ncbi:mitochondrial ribosomal protein S35 [Brevipalpus obovatus]|uniref:mitochondrial ribosomal protein S35 n=1 Tax=Brevipalpus obovatus TaxID=246614 RepID=UPI003D9E1D55
MMITRACCHHLRRGNSIRQSRLPFCTSVDADESSPDDVIAEEFEKMAFLPPPSMRAEPRGRRRVYESSPRYLRMAVNQDWNSVWPAARTFNPYVVPLPIYQGGIKIVTRRNPRRDKFNNHELLKIQNFLHLSPTNVRKQCAAIKKFCSPWPEGLDTDEKIDAHFPLKITTSDYCHASPTIRDPRARVVEIKFKLSLLELDEHSRDKMLRLLDERYDPKTDMVTITTDSCPLRKQNLDYALYQLTACYFESWKNEEWEEGKLPQDWERFFWDKSSSKQKAESLVDTISTIEKEDKIPRDERINSYSQAVAKLFEQGESHNCLDEYKKGVEKLLFK